MSTPNGASNSATGAEPGAELATVLQLQDQIDECTTKLQALEAALAENRQRAGSLRADLPSLEELARQRQYLAAGVALGTATQAELDTVEAQIADAQAQHESAKTQILQVDEVAAGIEQHLAEWQERLPPLRKSHAQAVRLYLAALIEAAGADYAAAAKAVCEPYERLLGLIGAFAHLAHPGTPIGPIGGELTIPGFGLKSIKDVMPQQLGGRLYPAAVSAQVRGARWDKARAEVQATGLRLPEEAA